MKTHSLYLLGLGCFFVAINIQAVDLKQSKVTQAVNEVQIISAADQKTKTAVVNDLFTMPDILRTGPASRAELVAPDQTITRVGANTIFSFDPENRTINLKQGSLLFHSPHGKGGEAIRTGSAVASVLGTTLIVTTTEKGGLKVINLEGDVEVKFLNGLKQKLGSGQMTFVLPGGGQLAPILNFRLDELTRHSQLVKGFNQPLASLPLINNQIEKQIKMLRSGKATDTGLYAGDDADSEKVEVIDADTIHRSPLNESKRADATINRPSLFSSRIPSPPYHVYTDTPFPLAANPFFANELFRGFIARNIYFNTTGPAAPTVRVDMNEFAGLDTFDFVSVRDMHFAGPVTFAGLTADNTLSLIGGRQITFAPGTQVRADVGSFRIRTPAALSLDEVMLVNLTGDIALTSGAGISLRNATVTQDGGDLTLNAANNLSIECSDIAAGFVTLNPGADSTVGVNGSTINAARGLIINGTGDVTVDCSTINADACTGNVTIGSENGSTTVTDTSITAHYLTLNSGDGILLDARGKCLTATGAGATASFTAPNLITVRNADLSSFGTINMAANTINLNNVNLGTGAVTLRSLLGLLNVGSSRSGYVNFICDVTYNGCAAQNYVNITPTAGQPPGIIVTTLAP